MGAPTGPSVELEASGGVCEGLSAHSPLGGVQGCQTSFRPSLLVGAMAAMASHASHAPLSSRMFDLQQGQL